MQSMRTPTVGLYCRISVDKSGKREGVERPRGVGPSSTPPSAGRAPRCALFIDNNLSGGDDHRPGYDELRAAVRAGEITHLWARDQARLERRHEWFALVAELVAADITELHTRHDGVVQIDGIGADVQAIVNARYIRDLRQKTRDKHERIAAAGRPNGGQPFGYRHGVDDQKRKSLIVHEDGSCSRPLGRGRRACPAGPSPTSPRS